MSDAALPSEDLSAERAGLAPLVSMVALGAVALHLYANTLGTMPDLTMAVLHFGLFGFLCALTRPAFTGRTVVLSRLALGLDLVLGVLALGFAAYVIAYEDGIFARQGGLAASDWLAGTAAIVLALEFARRTTGWIVPVLSLIALTYVVFWGRHMSGVFYFPGLSLETVLFRSSFSAEGMFGPIARISWSVVFMFLLFGAFLLRSGAGGFIIDLARLAAGRVTGGPGLVAVVASGLMGSVTGSAIANTVSTGVVTIPLMTRAGFPARQAAGIEAAASTGGQLMPPVMGAGAFVMVALTGTSYLTIIAVAAVPAILYFLSVAFIVRITARREGLVPDTLDQDKALRLGPVMARGWPFLLPLGVLVGLLIAGFTPTYAAGLAILAVIGASWLSPTPLGPGGIMDACLDAAKTMTATAMLLITVGLVIMVINTTGLGNTLSLMITSWAGGSLLLTLVLVAVASLVLGMGLPVTASYIVLATLCAPAIQGLILEADLVALISAGDLSDTGKALLMLAAPDQMGAIGSPMAASAARDILSAVPQELYGQVRDNLIDPARIAATLLAAHMVVFWLSQDSNVTPPVCLAAFAAAGIAKTPPMATGLTAWRIAKGLYVIPLLLATTPLIGGSALDITWIAVTAAAGLYALAGALEGYLEGPIRAYERVLVGMIGVSLLFPGGDIPGNALAATKLTALAVLVGLIVHTRRAHGQTGS